MSKKKGSNHRRGDSLVHKAQRLGVEPSFNRFIRDDKRSKRENSYFTPYTGALTENATLKTIKQPIANGHKMSVQRQNIDGYLTKGTFLDKIAFNKPNFTYPCRRRAERRRVMFALKLTGKGSGARRHKWTDLSSVSCK